MPATAKTVVASLIEDAPQITIRKTFTFDGTRVIVRAYPQASTQAGVTVDDLTACARRTAEELTSLGLKTGAAFAEGVYGGVAAVYYLGKPQGILNGATLFDQLTAAGFKENRSR